METRRIVFFLLLFLPFIVIWGCSCEKEEKKIKATGKYENLKYAQGFSYIKKKDGYDVYFSLTQKKLILRRTPGVWGAIKIPIKTIAVLSTSQVGHLVLLKKEHSLKAFSTLGFLSSPRLRQLVERGKIKEVGKFDQLDIEMLLEVKPDILLVNYFPEKAQTALSPLMDAGLIVIEIPSYLEGHPLGRAEWLYLYGLLYDELEKAKNLFDGIEKKYLNLTHLVKKNLSNQQQSLPIVLWGLPYKGIWHTPHSNTYLAKMVRDAGGVLWKSIPGAGVSALDFEAVLAEGKRADIWMFANNEITTRKMLLDMDHRYALFNAFKEGQLYNNNRRVVGKGNDYWETGIIEPHEILADFIQMLDESQMPKREMKYLLKVK